MSKFAFRTAGSNGRPVLSSQASTGARTGRRLTIRRPGVRRPGVRRRSTAAAVSAVLGLSVLGWGVAAPAASADTSVLLSQNKSATAYSTENVDYWPASDAVDGDLNTRWSSARSDPQWLQVDLGQRDSITSVELHWETAYSKDYRIEVSDDAKTWTPVATRSADPGGTETVPAAGQGRYVRLYSTARSSGYGISLWEFKVWGTEGTSGGSTPPTSPPPTSPPPTSPPPTSPPPSNPGTVPGNWTTAWQDTFDGPAGSSPSSADWLVRTGTQYPGGAAHWGTGSVETATASPDNVSLDGDGNLKITAVRDAAGNWTSGRLETQRADFAPQPGEMTEFKAVLRQPDVPDGLGYWPGFRATGADFRNGFTGFPGIGETDIMTDVNGRSQLANTLHCGTAPGGACNEYTGRTSGFASCTGCQTGFHEYAQVIDRTQSDEQIRFYLDGQQTWTMHESQVGVAAWNAALHHGFYLRLDLAIGGSLPDAVAGRPTPTAATSSGGSLVVSSVSVARSAGSTPAPLTDNPIPAGPSTVAVAGSQNNWTLQVNGAPYVVKGMTYGPPQDAGDGYLRDLKAMGANTIRIWGVDDAKTPGLLDAASRNGMKVIVGHWLNQGADYVNDTGYKDSVKAEILARVNALKNNQGVLMWDLGNEVLLTMQDHGLSADVVEQRRVAYAQFVDELAQAIHAADPNHPVTSTDAWTGAWKYYGSYSLHLDLFALNSYGAIKTAKQDWIAGHYTKPYILTEGGPNGEWEVPNDANGVPTEPTDLQKATQYADNWNTLMSHTGVALGGTEFNYGLENDFGGVWLNVFTGGWHRLGYYALQRAWTGQTASNTPPEISSLTLGADSVPAGGKLTVSTNVSDPNGDPIRYNLMYSDKYAGGGGGLRYTSFTETAPGQFTATAPATLGVWKVYVYAYDGHGNVGIEQRSFKVVPPPVAGTNIALGKMATASSFQPTGTDGPQSPDRAVDGNFSTRWASNWSADEWLQVDLGTVQPFNHVQLAWESAYATEYEILVSDDGTTFTRAYATTSGDGGFDDLDINRSARLVRVHATKRALSDFGYSLWEFGVYRS